MRVRKRPQEESRGATGLLLRSLLYSTAIVVGYFALPMDRLDSDSLVWLFAGLALVAVVLVWQIREITRSPFPRLRAAGALATSVPLFFGVFASTYFVMENAQPGSFNESLSKLDSAYFTVTVFATVGFGDIVPVSEVARAVTTVQMLGDLVIVGLVARVLFNAIQRGLSRRGD